MGELFEIQNTLSFNKDKLVDGNDFDYVTRTSQNQGILQETGFVNEENINPAGTWSLGLLQMDFFYREKPWYAGQFVRKIVPKIELNKSSILFFTVIFNKQKQNLLSGLVRDVDKAFLTAKIHLPTQNGQIDFAFMEQFIAELEERRIQEMEVERIVELEAYLRVTGLSDYILTEEERAVLEAFRNGKISWGGVKLPNGQEVTNIEWKMFRIGELFEINSYKKRFDANKVQIEEVGFPYVVRTALNNGIRGYINEDEEFLNEGNTISFGQDTATMFYQEKPYFTGDKIKIVKCKDESFNKLNAHFFIAAMGKAFSSFSWGSSSFSVEIIKNQNISLPSTQGVPLYAYMEVFIRAVQKLVIKEVVQYADRKITATREVVTKS